MDRLELNVEFRMVEACPRLGNFAAEEDRKNGVKGRSGDRQGPLTCKVRIVWSDVFDSLGSIPHRGQGVYLSGVIVLVRKRTCDGAYIFVTAAPKPCAVFFSAQRSAALERVIVERGSSRRNL